MSNKDLGNVIEFLIGISLIITGFCLLAYYFPAEDLGTLILPYEQNTFPYIYSESLLPVFLASLILGGVYLIKGNVRYIFDILKKSSH